MSLASENEFRPPEEFKRAVRERFIREADARYGKAAGPFARGMSSVFGRTSRGRAIRFALAASVLLGLGVWLALPGRRPEFGPAETARELVTADARVIADAGAAWKWSDSRRILLRSGRLFLDVEPGETPFEVLHDLGTITVHGTRIVVGAEGETVRVDVGSGEASLENDAGSVSLGPGEEGVASPGKEPVKQDARRFSHVAEFIADTVEEGSRGAWGSGSDEGFVPGVARVPGPSGQEKPLEVVRYHVDVHIEDGMARTTIDQTFYNPSPSRVEGTFLFPLPPDASISRLAMYVSGKLMEGGMAERSRAVEVYEKIVRSMKDPAILEWMEGSTFRLRIFPFEPHSERRIVLSYQQALESLYENDRYRFPILRPSADWGTFSIHAIVKGGAEEGGKISSPTYALKEVARSEGDLELAYEEKGARPGKDIILEVRRTRRPALDLASHETENERFICVTATPQVAAEVYRGPRRALFIADRSGKSSESERRAQIRMAEELLRALDRRDRIALLAYGTEPRPWKEDFVRRTRRNLAGAVGFLERESFFGAGDIAAAFRKARDLFGEVKDGDIIFYLGDGIDTMSGLEPEKIVEILPVGIRFLGIPLNRSYDRRLLGALAERSGGRVIPVSPDDRIAWRAFDLVSSLRTPEWKELEWELLDADGKAVKGVFHADRTNLRDGETVRIAGRIEGPYPASLRLRGERLPLGERRTGCAWIPRLWAKLRIDALERDSASEHREEIVRLGKQYYVMTPFTSLLVLENEAMYAQYKIDRGRRDHWALYPAPAEWHGKVRAPKPLSTWWNRPLGWGGPWIGSGNAAWSSTDSWSFQHGGFGGIPYEFGGFWLPAERHLRIVDNDNPNAFDAYLLAPSFDSAQLGVVNLSLAPLTVQLPGADGAANIFPDWIMIGGGQARSDSRSDSRIDTGLVPGWGGAVSPSATVYVPLGVDDDLWGVAHRVTWEDWDPSTGAAGIPFMGDLNLDGFVIHTPFTLADDSFKVPILADVPELGTLLYVPRLSADATTFMYTGLAHMKSGGPAEGFRYRYGLPVRPPSQGPAHRQETELLEKVLPRGIDLTVSTDDVRVVVFSSGERLVREGGSDVYIGQGKSAVFDPLFNTSVGGGPASLGAWARMPWFLVPLEFLVAAAEVTERTEGDLKVVAIDRGGLTTAEFHFAGRRPVEVRVVLRGGQILQRVVYDAWDEIQGRSLPNHGTFLGPGGNTVGEVAYSFGSPGRADRDRLAELRGVAEGAGQDASHSEFLTALLLYRAGNRAQLEALLKEAEKNGRASDALRKVARLAAIRWGSDAVVEAPALDPQAPEVRRWLPSEPLPLGYTVERSIATGDVTTLAAMVLSVKEPEEVLKHLERLRGGAPRGLRGLLDLWTGDLALRKGWSLKAYDAFSRARAWKPLEKSVPLLDRLAELALGLNDAKKALEHAEDAVGILSRQRPSVPLGDRFAKLAEIAGKDPEIWKRRGQGILERWAAAAPRDPEPFARLASLYRETGRPALAFRCASQQVELAPSSKAYTELATELEGAGDAPHAEICRRIAERLKK